MAKSSSEQKTEVAQGSTVRGRLTGAEDLVISGRLEGSIDLKGDLAITKSGIVKANILAERVSVLGIVVGDIMASVAIEIGPEGKVKGDLTAPTVKIADGGRYAGALQIGEPSEDARRPAAPRFVAPVPAAEEYEEVEEAYEDDETMAPIPGLAAVRGGREDDRRKRRIVVKKRS
jgi:cytoskeletal protein CcmA (bactofilin family)